MVENSHSQHQDASQANWENLLPDHSRAEFFSDGTSFKRLISVSPGAMMSPSSFNTNLLLCLAERGLKPGDARRRGVWLS